MDIITKILNEKTISDQFFEKAEFKGHEGLNS